MFSPAEVISRLDAGKTVMLYTLNSTYNAIRPKALFSFNTRSVPRYLKVDELLRDDIIHWRRNGTAVAILPEPMRTGSARVSRRWVSTPRRRNHWSAGWFPGS